MPIEFNRIQNSGYFNKYYGNYTSVSGWSTAPYSQGWSNRFGPPFANERIDTDGYDVFANPGICIGSGINQGSVPSIVSTDINGKYTFAQDFGYRTPWYGPVNNIYKITIAGITNGSNPGDCTDCSLLNGTYYVNTTDTSIRGRMDGDPNGNTLVTPPVRINNHVGSTWSSPVSKNKDAPCGNKVYNINTGGFDYAVFTYEATSEFINLALIQDQPYNGGGFTGSRFTTSGNVLLEVYIGKSLGDVRPTEFTQTDNYNAAFSKNFGPLNLTGGHQNDNRPLMLEGIHTLTPITGSGFYGTLIRNSGDNQCNYLSATCTVEPYKTEDWDFRQTRHFFEEPYGLISYQNGAPMCSGISFPGSLNTNGYANLIPSAFYLAFSGITNKFTNQLCVPCDTYFSKPVTLKQSSATSQNDGFAGGNKVSTNRYEWAGNHNSSSYLTKYNICEYGAYDYILNSTSQSASIFNTGFIPANMNPTNPSGFISFGLNKIRFDVISSGYLVPAGGGLSAQSGYRDLSAWAVISIVNGPAVGPTFTKILCSDITSCLKSGAEGSSYAANQRHSHSGILPCLSSDFWNGGWAVDSGIVMENGYGVSPSASSIYYSSSVAHLCDFTSSQPVIRTNTDFSRGLEPSRQNPTIFCTNKQVPQTLTVNYTSISGSITYIYNKNGLNNSWGDMNQTLLSTTQGVIYIDDTDKFKFRWNLNTNLIGGSLSGMFYNGVFHNTPYPQDIILGTNIGSSGNRIMDCSTGNWSFACSGQYLLSPGTNSIIFNITATLGDFVTVDYP